MPDRPPPAPTGTGRSYGSIVRANVLTIFNLILGVFGAVTLIYGDWRDALFLGILVANTSIGIVQEVRAKRALERLAALVAPTATVVRDGQARPLHVDEVVPGDLVRLAPGDQVVADGPIVAAEGLTLDESILSGESVPVRRGEGEEARSGSFAVEGRGSYLVEAVGVESYAERIAGEARAFRHPRSPLEREFNRLLLFLVAVMLPLSAVLGVSLWERNASLDVTVDTSVAAVVSLVPEGLMVLASLTYAVAAIRMSRRGALAQQLNAIESLAAADIICTDKTGTLTESALQGGRGAAGAEAWTRRRSREPWAPTPPARLLGTGHSRPSPRRIPAHQRTSRPRCHFPLGGAGAHCSSTATPSCSAPRSSCPSASWASASQPSSKRAGESSQLHAVAPSGPTPTTRGSRTIWCRSGPSSSRSSCDRMRARPWSTSARKGSS